MQTRKPSGRRTDRRSLWLFVVGGLLVALGLAFFVSPYASGDPDGLNKVAVDQGFADAESDHASAQSPLAGYGVEGVGDETLSTGLAGIVGVAVTFGVAMILFAIIRTGRGRTGEQTQADP
jgi:cobalt/nickel transport system permease protein